MVSSAVSAADTVACESLKEQPLETGAAAENIDNDITLPQETIFKLTISPSVGDPFEIQVNSAEMVQELHQILLEREATCHRTCFSIQLNNVQLDNFTEIRNIHGLEDGSTLTVVDEPFTVREARIHIRHVRELLKSNDPTEAANAIDGNSLTFLPSINIQERKEKEKPFDGQPPDYVLPGTKERILTSLLPSSTKITKAIKNMSISAFNPPVGPRKIKGDVLYLFVDILEKRRLHITCCTKGFFVNCSTDDVFNPSVNPQLKNVYPSLVDLLSVASPSFKKAYSIILKKRSERQMTDRLPTPYPVFSWLSPPLTVSEDGIRAEDTTMPHRVGFEDHLPGQIRDWNEELQTTHEMPRSCLGERVVRDRSIFKIHGDFISAAIKGATSIVDGNVMAINPADDPKTHMFIWNNIFYSLGYDVKEHYKELGGDAAAFAAMTADLQGVKAYSAIDDPKLCTLGMAVIDYRGCRITAQSIIPGILDREQEQSVIYGSVDFGKTVNSSERYHDILEATAKRLHISPHEVVTGADKKLVKLFTSYETKGIIGNDGRQYVLDLLRTMPPDVHYMEDAEVSENARKLGFPRTFPHKLAALRQELIDCFYEVRCLQFIKAAAQHIRESVAGKDVSDFAEMEKEVTRILVEVSEGREPVTDNASHKEALTMAARAVGSLKDNTFDISFNPDCFSTTVEHAESEDLEKQRKLVIEAAEFLLTHQLPELVQNCIEFACNPIDGEGFSDMMHSRGINIRYLGEVAKLVDKKTYLRPIVVSEILARSLKHVVRQLIYPLSQDQLGQAICHLLNCIFGNVSGEAVSPSEKSGKKSTRKPNKKSFSGEWASLSTPSIWKLISDEALSYYGFSCEAENLDYIVSEFAVQRVSLLRRVCRILGIQLLSKDYQLDSKNGKPIFVEDDIQGVFPVMKHREPAASDAKKMYQRAQHAMQMSNLKEAYESVAESVNLMTSVYGALHPDLAQSYRLLARLSYILGDPAEALSQQHKATLVSERCNGLDHGYTIIEYINLAHFAFANLYISASLRLLYRARHLLLIVHGETHPVMAQIDGNIGVILFAVQEFDSALKFLQSAEANAVGEPKRLKNALLNHLIARCNASRGDFRAALAAEKETYSIYDALLGKGHEKTKESSEFLKVLTQQAVTFQKRMMEANKGSTLSQLLPLQIQQLSLSAILDVLNILNGVVIISVGQPNVTEETAKAIVSKDLTEETLD